ncbi:MULTISPECIES: LptF/LptG family permease [Proteiniphilum]|uniref:LptF/LptG family permease n=1 Tax=Proteiniphilum TaxID=294702 RepID=UPI001EEC69DF|nr:MULTISPECIES: LptF/LptG family permease [Proteiniphilum]ULB35274.1 LptF/LptG family permease [Proteiniphilum propionicum]
MRLNSFNHIKLKRLDRYIIKKFLGTYIFMIALIISIAVVFDINEKIDKFMTNNASLHSIIFDYYLNFIPYYTNLFSPLFVFLAVIFFTSKMANNSEIIAILSNGISFKRLMKPYMISAFVIAVFAFIFGSYLIPPANATRIEFENTYIDPRKKKVGDRDIQFKVGEGTIVYFGNFDLGSKTGYSFSIDHFDNLHLSSRLTAQSIRYDSAYHWTISDYQIRSFNGLKETITHGSSIDTTLQIVPNDFIIAKTDHQMMSSPQLRRYIHSQKERGMGNIQSFQIEYHSRIASVFSAFILTIIGVSLSARKVKGGMGLNIGIGLVLSMAYILFMTVSSTFAVKGGMSPFIATWIPNVIFTGIALYLYKRSPN